MMREDVLIALGIIKVAFPYYYKDISKKEAENVVSLWCDIFADYDATLVVMAIKTIIASDPGSFPPSIGAVRAEADQIKKLISNLSPTNFSLNDYLGEKHNKYPLSVREYIVSASNEGFKRIYGYEPVRGIALQTENEKPRITAQ